MATEILAVPEEDLEIVIKVIREGLRGLGFNRKTRQEAKVSKYLHYWCDTEEKYLVRLRDD